MSVDVSITDGDKTVSFSNLSEDSDNFGKCEFGYYLDNAINQVQLSFTKIWELRFEIQYSKFDPPVTLEYTYVPNQYCSGTAASTGEKLFYCHDGLRSSQTGNPPQSADNDLYLVLEAEQIHLVPASLSRYFFEDFEGPDSTGAVFKGRGINEAFVDATEAFGDEPWVWPYSFYNEAPLLAATCQGLSGTELTQCEADARAKLRSVNYFLTPQTGPSYDFPAGYDLIQPADQEWTWDLSGESVSLPVGTQLLIEGELDVTGMNFTERDSGQGWGGLRFEPGSDGTLTNTTISGVGEDCPVGGFCPFGYSVYIDDASPVFSGVNITDSGGDGIVHGVYVRGLTSFPRFENGTTIEDQTGDGVILASRAQALFDQAFILDNDDDGLSAGFNTRAYFRETTIELNGDIGALATSGGEIRFGEPGGPLGDTDGYNIVFDNGGFGLRAQTNSAIRAGDLATTRYSTIESNDGGTVRAQGSSAVAYLNLNYWGGNEPTFSEASGGQTFADRYCTQPPTVGLGCSSLPFGTSNSRTRGGRGVSSRAAMSLDADPNAPSARRTGLDGDSTALDVLAKASTLASQGQTDDAFDAFQGLIARYPADPSAGTAFGEISRLFLTGSVPGALDFLQGETQSREVLHRLWAWEALARSYDALGRSDAALDAATNLDAEVKSGLAALERTEFGQAQRLDWQIAGGVVRYYVLLREERWAEAGAELGVLSVLAPGHAVVEGMYAEAREAGLKLGDGGGRLAGGPDTPEQTMSKAREATVERPMLGAVYPNPAATQVTVPLLLTEAAEVRVTVVDLLGREVAVLTEGPQQAGRHALPLDTASLAPGLYVVRAAVDDAPAQTQRFSVVR